MIRLMAILIIVISIGSLSGCSRPAEYRLTQTVIGGHNAQAAFRMSPKPELVYLMIQPVQMKCQSVSRFDEATFPGHRGWKALPDRIAWNGRVEVLENGRRVFVVSKGTALHAFELTDTDQAALTPDNIQQLFVQLPVWKEKIKPVLDIEDHEWAKTGRNGGQDPLDYFE